MRQLALIAHDARKDELVAFIEARRGSLAGVPIVCTGTTGSRIARACPELGVEGVKSGPLGGDQQIGARIAEGKVFGMVFFLDPLTPMPHDVDVKALMRLAALYNVPFALNEATAALILDSGLAAAELAASAEAGR